MSATLVERNVTTLPFKFESDIQQSTVNNQAVTVSGTFLLIQKVWGSSNTDAPWGFPFNQGLVDHGFGNEFQVPFSVSGTVPTAGQSYWARLWTTSYEGDEIWALKTDGVPKAVNVRRDTDWYDKGTNTTALVITN